jgi:dihydroorotate dehydrogenase
MGFNNDGATKIAARLAARYRKRRPECVLGVNIGKSKVVDLSAALDDYLASTRALGPLADYLVVNVSSPNTPGLRDLQAESSLRPLLEGIRRGLDEASPSRNGRRKPLLLKIAPDLADASIDAAVDVALSTGCDGLIATNTTIGRGGLSTPSGRVEACGAGGLSGAPLRARSTVVLARVARRVEGRVPVIGVGGVDSAEAAWEKIVHGASLVQVYTGLVYEGPGLVGRIHRGLVRKLDEHGLPDVRSAIGRAL